MQIALWVGVGIEFKFEIHQLNIAGNDRATWKDISKRAVDTNGRWSHGWNNESVLITEQSNAGNTRSINLYQKLVQVVWYKKLARVSVNLVQAFLVQVFCTQLSTALFHHRNCPACDTNRATWLAGEMFYASNSDKLVWNFLCKCLVQVSWACVAGA